DQRVTRLLHANGVRVEQLGLGRADVAPREVWRIFAEHWHVFAGTGTGYWIADVLATHFGLDGPNSSAPDSTYDEIARRCATPDCVPRALFERFGIEALATSEDALDNLEPHERLAGDSTFSGRVVPALRLDAYTDVGTAGFRDNAHSVIARYSGTATS